MSKWFLRSKTLWVNGLATGGLLLALQDQAASEIGNMGLALTAPIGNTALRFATTQAVGRMGKSVLKSKTMLFNIALLIGGGFAFAGDQSGLGAALVGLAVVNLALRLTTRSGVTVLPHPSRRH